MSRLELPGLVAGVAVIVGWDRVLGFFADVRRPGQPAVQYDRTTTDDGTTSLAGVLHALVGAGCVSRDDIVDADGWLAQGDLAQIPSDRPGLRLAAEVIVHLRTAAGR